MLWANEEHQSYSVARTARTIRTVGACMHTRGGGANATLGRDVAVGCRSGVLDAMSGS